MMSVLLLCHVKFTSNNCPTFKKKFRALDRPRKDEKGKGEATAAARDEWRAIHIYIAEIFGVGEGEIRRRRRRRGELPNWKVLLYKVVTTVAELGLVTVSLHVPLGRYKMSGTSCLCPYCLANQMLELKLLLLLLG